MATPTQSDEIDLGYILNTINKIFKKSLLLIFRGIEFALRNWLIVLLLIIAGVVLGYFAERDFKPAKISKVTLRTNFETAGYTYNALEILLQKSLEADTLFLKSKGFATDTIEVLGLEINPIINFQDITDKYDQNNRVLEALLRNLEFEDDLELAESFNTEYKYHTLNLILSPYADISVMDKVLAYLNDDNKLIQNLTVTGRKILVDKIEGNEFTIRQMDTILNNYYKNESLSSSSSDIFVVDKNFSIHAMVERKMEVLEELGKMKIDLVYSDKAILPVNTPVLINAEKRILQYKMIIYPVLFVFLFFFFSWFRHTYFQLRSIARRDQ